VLFPSAGTALALALALGSVWRRADERSRHLLGWGAIVALVALVPLNWSRNVRLQRTATVSSRALAAVGEARGEIASGKPVVLLDEPGKMNFAAAFGTLIGEAVRLQTDVPHAQAWIEPPPPDWHAAGMHRPSGPAVQLQLRGLEVRRIDR
jgi:hypothetical protein